jgi:hypothetical protein
MSFQKVFITFFILIFGTIGTLAFLKKQKTKQEIPAFEGKPIEINLQDLEKAKVQKNIQQNTTQTKPQAAAPSTTQAVQQAFAPLIANDITQFPKGAIDLLFQKNSPLPIVETIQYKSRVSWKPGKAAWLIDYAQHYLTPLDFIARSINNCPDYTIRTISDGLLFNVLRTDKEFSFYIVIDLSRCSLWLYYLDPEAQERVFLKGYHVALGRLDSKEASGSLTPIGTYKLGSRVGVFKPKMMGWHKGNRVELITVFGTRWIPFEHEVEGCSAPAKGLGIHGTPWEYNPEQGMLVDNESSLGKYESDGCIRLKTADNEELFSIISTRGALVELVRDIKDAKLPYKERSF